MLVFIGLNVDHGLKLGSAEAMRNRNAQEG